MLVNKSARLFTLTRKVMGEIIFSCKVLRNTLFLTKIMCKIRLMHTVIRKNDLLVYGRYHFKIVSLESIF